MTFTAEQIAAMLNGTLEGDPKASVNTITKIQDAQPGSLAFLANPKYEEFIYNTKASIVLVNNGFEPKHNIDATLIYTENAYSAFTTLLEQYDKLNKRKRSGREANAFVDETADVAENTYVGAFSYIGRNSKVAEEVEIFPQVYIGDNVTIGKGTILMPGVKIGDGTIIGQNCKIQFGVIVGGDGFGFAPQADGSYKTIPQLGIVVIEDNVNIGANSTIDRATMGQTIIKKGVKLDNLVQIAHNAEIGENTVMAAQTGIAGSTKIGKQCVFAGQVGIAGHIEVADGTTLGAKSGLSRTVRKSGQTLFGAPAIDNKQQARSLIVFQKLPEMQKQLQELEKKLLNLSS